MVSADNLHYDVLTLIFGYLPLPDLASVSAVSRSFQASAEPWLYRTLPFTHAQAKRYALFGSADSTSPFTVMLSQPHRASYVRTIDLRVIPNERRRIGVFDARWMADTREAVEKATNLTAFTCTIARAVPAFLSPLWDKSRLTYLRINAALSNEAPMGLLRITTLRVLILEEPTYFVLNALPRWAEKLKNTLLHLTVVGSKELNTEVLSQSVKHLNHLLGLHLSGCPLVDHADVFALAPQLPHLQSLSTTLSAQPPRTPPVDTFSSLQHLALEIHARASTTNYNQLPNYAVHNPHPLSSVLPLVGGSRLRSLALKSSTSDSLDTPTLHTFLASHGESLRVLRLHGLSLSTAHVYEIAARAPKLHRLYCPVKEKELPQLGGALSGCENLRVLVDVGAGESGSGGASSGPHGPITAVGPMAGHHAGRRPSLTTEPVKTFMRDVPSLKKVVCENRVWTASESSKGLKKIKFERQKRTPARGLAGWFMPPAESAVEGLPTLSI